MREQRVVSVTSPISVYTGRMNWSGGEHKQMMTTVTLKPERVARLSSPWLLAYEILFFGSV